MTGDTKDSSQSPSKSTDFLDEVYEICDVHGISFPKGGQCPKWPECEPTAGELNPTAENPRTNQDGLP